MKRLLPLLLLLASCAATDEKKPEYTITFHAQGSETDSPKTMFPYDLNGRRIIFKVVPEFSQQNIIAFHPFPAAAGGSSGAVLHLDFRGKSQLEIITRTRKDEYLLTLVDARPVDFVVLDQPVLDGVVTIWQGLSDEVIKKMDKVVQRMHKSGTAPTMSKDMEMRPTTRGEKIRSYDAAKAREKEAKAGKTPKAQEVPALNLPDAPVSPKIPVEGAAPPPPPLPPATGPEVPRSGTEPPLPRP